MDNERDTLAAYIAEREFRRKRAWEITCGVAVVLALAGGIGWGVHAAGADERERDQKQEQFEQDVRHNLDCAIHGGSDC